MFKAVDEAPKPKQFSSRPVKKAAASEPHGHGLVRWKTSPGTMFFLLQPILRGWHEWGFPKKMGIAHIKPITLSLLLALL